MLNLFRTATLAALVALPVPSQAQEAFNFVAIGDMPYVLPKDYARFDRLIDKINKETNAAFTIHVGDIKSGSSPCSDEIFQKVFDQFQTFAAPLVYTPGDNEWTDCHRAKAGGHNPLERLAKVRAMFFPKPGQTLGKVPMTVESQALVMPEKFAKYVENTRFVQNGVMFVMVHVVGSNNNFEPGKPEVAMEYFERDAANIAWMDDSFKKAGESGARAIVFSWQADVMDISQKEPEVPRASAFVNTIKAVERGAKTFGKPVLVIHGDEHIFQIGPFLDTSKKPIPNVMRLEVFGEKHIHGVIVHVDPATPGVFGYTPLIVPENLGKN
jgi:hypothetical protein